MTVRSLFPRRRSPRRPISLLLGLLGLSALCASASPAAADACSSCTAPTSEQIEAQPDFPKGDWPSGTYGETLACECSYKLSGTPTVTQGPAWLVFRGSGEVWTCPESSSEDAVTIEIAEGDSTSWSLTTEASASVSAMALSVALKVAAGQGGGHVITEVKRVTKTIRAAMGHRIPWEGYFELADFTMDMDLAVTRRWSWWVKNVHTGHVVLASGSINMDCGIEHATLTRRGSIGYRFRLKDAPCNADSAESCSDLGWWPLPPRTTPVTPGAGPLPPTDPAPPPTTTPNDPDEPDEPDEPNPAGCASPVGADPTVWPPPSPPPPPAPPTGPLGDPFANPSSPPATGSGTAP